MMEHTQPAAKKVLIFGLRYGYYVKGLNIEEFKLFAGLELIV
jgi:hypothetical protein